MNNLTPDVFNGLFEFIGGCFLCLNIKNLYKDKVLRGVSWLPTVFMSSWGAWNLYYYPSLNQWWSFYGGLWIVTVNTVWLGMILYYYLKKRKTINFSSKNNFDTADGDLQITVVSDGETKVRSLSNRELKKITSERSNIINQMVGEGYRRISK